MSGFMSAIMLSSSLSCWHICAVRMRRDSSAVLRAFSASASVSPSSESESTTTSAVVRRYLLGAGREERMGEEAAVEGPAEGESWDCD